MGPTRRTLRGTGMMSKLSAASKVAAAVALFIIGAGDVRANTTPAAGAAATTADGSTPLHWAVYNDDAAEVKRLLKAGADVKAANVYGVTAMELAGETGNPEVIRALLEAGADVESANPEGQTALMSVARTGNVEAAKLLIRHGADVNATERFGGQTALMWAAARRHPGMVDLLASKGADVNARAIVRNFERHITVEQRYKNTHTGGLTPLLYAVRENCRACVEALIRHKADILLPDPDGIAPLTLAMMNLNWDIAKRLLDAGADVNQWDIYGQAPLHVAIENAYVSNRGGILNAGSDGTPNEVEGRSLVQWLVEKGADPNQQMFFRAPREAGQVSASMRGTTPFHRAVASNNLELIRYLLDHGADVKLNTAAQQSVMMLAIGGRGREEDIIATLRLLHEAGADPNVVRKVLYINRDRGGTALHAATEKNARRIMSELVALGADPDVKDEDGLTALDYAMSRGWLSFLTTRPPPRLDIAKHLRQLGATVELASTPDWPGEFPPIGPPRNHESEIWPL